MPGGGGLAEGALVKFGKGRGGAPGRRRPWVGGPGRRPGEEAQGGGPGRRPGEEAWPGKAGLDFDNLHKLARPLRPGSPAPPLIT